MTDELAETWEQRDKRLSSKRYMDIHLKIHQMLLGSSIPKKRRQEIVEYAQSLLRKSRRAKASP
jgi:hypothetical protein